jgi:UPF0176 protein
MKRALLLPLLGLLAACGTTDTSGTPNPAPAAPPAATTSAAPTKPPNPEPVKDGNCPYLDTKFVAEANGQLVRKVALSADEPNPTCFFYANATEVQLTVRVYVGDTKIAKTLVDEAAPRDKSNEATVPAGWGGGYMTTQNGAVYAVAKDGAAVVVTTNQKQTIKARRIAETAIGNLKLGY